MIHSLINDHSPLITALIPSPRVFLNTTVNVDMRVAGSFIGVLNVFSRVDSGRCKKYTISVYVLEML